MDRIVKSQMYITIKERLSCLKVVLVLMANVHFVTIF